jgi:hypothetical protein
VSRTISGIKPLRQRLIVGRSHWCEEWCVSVKSGCWGVGGGGSGSGSRGVESRHASLCEVEMVGCGGGGGGGCGGFRGVGGSCQVDVVEEVAVVVGCLTSKSAQTNASACSRRSEPDDAGRLAAANYCEFREGNEYGKRIKAEKNFLFFFFFFLFKGDRGLFWCFRARGN